jgi:hypothetical protein
LGALLARDTSRMITVVGDPVLATPCRPATEFGASLTALVDDMAAWM